VLLNEYLYLQQQVQKKKKIFLKLYKRRIQIQQKTRNHPRNSGKTLNKKMGKNVILTMRILPLDSLCGDHERHEVTSRDFVQ